MSYRRSQDFSISSMIQFNCDGSLSTTKKWTIKNCTSTSCSFEIVLNEKVMTTFSELYIPSRTLAYGVYQLTLTVTMIDSPNLKSSSSAYVRITATGITANLVQLGTSMITRGDQQDLLLDPGTFSVDPDEDTFDATKWKYTYYCRIYDLYNFPNIQGILLSIDDSRIDPYNPSCLSNRSGLIFGNLTLSPNSSLTVLGGSLQLNQMYQFMVYMENRKNSSIQATGYVLVTIEVTHPQLIAVGCVISSMCVPNLEFQLLNPTTQVALFTLCIGTCTNLERIKWHIYQGSDNSTSSNSTQWTLFNQTSSYENIWFFGTNTSNFTATDLLFLNNLQISLWRFEVVYTFQSAISTSALNFIINQPPANGSCSINPLDGTMTTLFNITCPNWYDVDGIQDYSLYAWTTDISQRTIIAFSPEDNFQVRLPVGDNETSLLNLVVYVRDLVGSVTQVNISSVNVIADLAIINDLIDKITNLSSTITNNPIVRLLSSGNQNVVGQMITSLSQEFNQMNSENLDKAISNGIPVATILVSSLGSSSLQQVSIPLNESALINYNTELNSLANVRDYLVTFITQLLITTSNSIILQSSSLVQLTQATNQLTRNTLILVSNRCYELSAALYAIFEKISYEDAQSASNQLFQCASNLLNAVNGPLQGRTEVLDLDYSRANAISTDYDTDLESAWSNLNLFSDGNDFSTETIEKNRNIYYQKQLANQINSQVTKMISLLTSSLNIHLNIGQSSLMNTSQSFVSLETISIASLKDRLVKQVENAQFNIPSDFILNTTSNSSISLRSRVDPLASFGNFQNTNLSRSVSLSIIDQNGNDVSFQAHQNNPIQLIIPRDPNVLIPSMYLQNVTSINSTMNNLLFNYHYINITSSLPISVHFEIHSLNRSLAYLFIYKFDQTPQLNSSINLIDGWTIFCPYNLTNDDIYRYFIDNQQTPGHQSLIFGIRELNSTEMNNYLFLQSQPLPPLLLLPPVPQAAVPLSPPVPQVALLPQVLQQVVAVRPAALLLLLLPPVLQVVVPLAALLLPQAVPLLLLPPPLVLQRVAAALQVVLLRVAAVPQVVLLRVAVVPQAALQPRPPLAVLLLLPLLVLLQAVVVLQVALLLPPAPQVLQQVAAVPQVVLPLLLPVPVLQVAPLAVAAPQAALQRVVAVLQVALLPLPPPPVVLQRAAAVPQVAQLQAAAVSQVVLLLPLLVPVLQVVPLPVSLQVVAAPQVAVPQLVLLLPLAVPQVARLPS
ncbi:unnamed protein product [Adineta steineri]|uniref:PKD/REJ-like domain-containing protein n=2 Tax=Adineta steineri TaxID=433720 RepID=A0A815M024_9BILA|nr:unnamed protein product [Adineta steineri]